ETDGDPDLEEGDDLEADPADPPPWLGIDDEELDRQVDDEPIDEDELDDPVEDEQSLGWTLTVRQDGRDWLGVPGFYTDTEFDPADPPAGIGLDEDELEFDQADERDGPYCVDDEPTLGWPEPAWPA